MNLLHWQLGSLRFLVDPAKGIDISIPLVFGGEQPVFFEAPPATAQTFSVDGFTGDTRAGGSCNVLTCQLTPHCNGTHTECVGHVVDDENFVPELLTNAFLPATLITLTPGRLGDAADDGGSRATDDDAVFSAVDVTAALEALPLRETKTALVVRSLPNEEEKAERHYSPDNPPPYFTRAAMEVLVRWGVRHLVVDLPTVDRMNDDGELVAHRVFWGLPSGSRSADDAQRSECTISEMAYIPDFVRDGYYLLNLQLPAFMTDAAPSRPILFPLEPA